MRTRYNLFSLLLLLTIICMALGYLGLRYAQYHSGKNQLAKLDQLLRMQYDDFDGSYVITESNEELSIREFFAGDWKALTIREVRVKLTDPVRAKPLIQQLERIDSLQELDLGSSQNFDSYVDSVVLNCPQLKTLNLFCADVSDRSIPHLATLCDLEKLDLRITNVTGKGFKLMATGCPKLKSLNLEDSKLTDDGLVEIAKCQSLEHLDISENDVLGDTVVAMVEAQFPNLKLLEIRHIKFSKESMARLLAARSDLEILGGEIEE